MDALNNFFLTSPSKAWLPVQTVKPTVDAHLNEPQLGYLKKVHRRLAGKALIYVGSGGFAFCSWEGRPPDFPANVDEPILTYCKKPCASAPLREIILFAL
jgi:hypothetical protein